MTGSNNLFFNPNCRALIIGSSGAIGSAIVENLKKIIGSHNIVTLCRSQDGLDFFKPETIVSLAVKQTGQFQLILDATGALEIKEIGPEKSLNTIELENMLSQFKVNAVGPALLMKHFVKFLPRTGKAVFATLSARVGSIEDNRLGGWVSYRASKAALNQIVKTASVEALRKNPHSVFLSLHPGTVKSKLTANYLKNREFTLPDQAAKSILRIIEQKTFRDTGGFYAVDGKKIPY